MSVPDCHARAETELERLDMAIREAGISAASSRPSRRTSRPSPFDVGSTFLLALALLPKLKETSAKFEVRPTLTIITSDVHYVMQFKEKDLTDGQAE